jgi:hypothetical protein
MGICVVLVGAVRWSRMVLTSPLATSGAAGGLPPGAVMPKLRYFDMPARPAWRGRQATLLDMLSAAPAWLGGGRRTQPREKLAVVQLPIRRPTGLSVRQPKAPLVQIHDY